MLSPLYISTMMKRSKKYAPWQKSAWRSYEIVKRHLERFNGMST